MRLWWRRGDERGRTGEEPAPEGAAPLPRWRRLRRPALWTGGLVVLAGVLVLSLSMWWTSQPAFCNRCHKMEPFVAAWQTSSHQTVNCERCHTSPGVFGFVGGKVASLQVVVNYATGHYEDWSFNAVVPNAACLQCHDDIMHRLVHSTGVVAVDVSHKDIIESGGKCIFCHSTIAHGEAVPVGSRTHPTMAACMQCHNDKTAPLQCSLCHPGRVDGDSDRSAQGDRVMEQGRTGS